MYVISKCTTLSLFNNFKVIPARYLIDTDSDLTTLLSSACNAEAVQRCAALDPQQISRFVSQINCQ